MSSPAIGNVPGSRSLKAPCSRGFALAPAEARVSTGQDGFFRPSAETVLALPTDGVFDFTGTAIGPGITAGFSGAAPAISFLALDDVVIGGRIDTGGRHLTIASPGNIIIANGMAIGQGIGTGDAGFPLVTGGTLSISAGLTANSGAALLLVPGSLPPTGTSHRTICRHLPAVFSRVRSPRERVWPTKSPVRCYCRLVWAPSRSAVRAALSIQSRNPASGRFWRRALLRWPWYGQLVAFALASALVFGSCGPSLSGRRRAGRRGLPRSDRPCSSTRRAPRVRSRSEPLSGRHRAFFGRCSVGLRRLRISGCRAS